LDLPTDGQPVADPDRRTRWTAPELVATDFPPIRWAVPGLVAEGLTLLAGPPKIGKSWMSYGLAVDIAAGRPALGGVDVEAGSVLYLALEDTGRRLKDRLTTILGDHPAPEGLTLETECPRFGQGAETYITQWLNNHKDARLVIIDTLAKIRARTPVGAQQYDADYAALATPKAIADHHGVAILMVHHVRKLGAEDPFDTISGTNGVMGSADAAMILERSRGTADATLNITGRDIEENERALSFDPANGAWTILPGAAVDHTLDDTRAAILRYVRDHPDTGPTDIATSTDIALANVKKACRRMETAGQLRTIGRGRYRTTDTQSDTHPP
jgi:hypothetical protein